MNETIIHEPLFPYKGRQIRSVAVIAFDDEGKVLGIKRGRTFDIIRGRQEWDDDTHEDAARREAREQAGVTLGTVALAAIVETKTDEQGSSSLELVMTAFVQEVAPLPIKQDKKRRFFDTQTFIRRFRFGKPEDMKTLLMMAEFYRVKKLFFKHKKTVDDQIREKSDFRH